MLLIKNYIKDTGKYGLGLFTSQALKKGQKIWEFNSILDKKITEQEASLLPKIALEYLKEYSPLDENIYNLDGDFTKHMNHSFTPNIGFIKDEAFALKDINKDEELLANYSEFDLEFREGRPGFIIEN